MGLELKNGLSSSGPSNFVQVNTNVTKFIIRTYGTIIPAPTTPQSALSHILTVSKSQARHSLQNAPDAYTVMSANL